MKKENETIQQIFNLSEAKYKDKITERINEFLRTCREQFESFKKLADDIKDIDKRIIFWSDKKVGFRKNLTLANMQSSGATRIITGLTDSEFFLDGMISYEIANLKLQKELSAKKGNSKSKDFDLTEKLLILSFLQDKKEFPKYNPVNGETQTQFEKIISLLLNESEDSVEKAFKKVRKIKGNIDLSPNTARPRLTQLEKVQTFFKGVKHSTVVSEIEKLQTSIQEKVKL